MTEVGVNEILISSSNPKVDSDFRREIIIQRDTNLSDVRNNNNGVTSPSTDLYKCSRCPKMFVSEYELTNHESRDHAFFYNHRHGAESGDKALLFTKCPFCQGAVSGDLAAHLLAVHPDRLVPKNENLSPQKYTKTASFGKRRATSPRTLEDVNLLLTVGSAPTSRPSSPVRHAQDDAYPMNLSVHRRLESMKEEPSFGGHRNSRSAPVSDGDDDSGTDNNNSADSAKASASNRKRRKQTHVPDQNKDERYWARRLKNNEAAKRSRDMRIKRERVIFEENARLEKISKDLKADLDRLSMDNKELNLKMGFILEENLRLKSMLGMVPTEEVPKKEDRLKNDDDHRT